MKYNVKFSCVNHIGRRRCTNQDNFVCDEKYLDSSGKTDAFSIDGEVKTTTPQVFGVFDGMGGEECGEIAAFIAAECASKINMEKSIKIGLTQYSLTANRQICDYAEKNNVSTMGTTAAMLVFTQNEVTMMNIGDSKVYRINDGCVIQISKDHVAYGTYSSKPPLSQNLGIPPEELTIEPYIYSEKPTKNGRYLICSDGLTDMVPIQEIEGLITNTPFEQCAETLLNSALEKGGKDNVTIITLEIKKQNSSLFEFFSK